MKAGLIDFNALGDAACSDVRRVMGVYGCRTDVSPNDLANL